MEIRKPNIVELESILKLSPQALFEGTLGRVRPTDERIKRLVEPLLERGRYYLIAAEKDNLMGWILIGSIKDQFTDEMIGFIYELYVTQEYRGKGISKHLMKSAIEHLQSEGYPEIRLGVFADNHAVRLYKQMGFSERNITMSLRMPCISQAAR
ncbi:GNAT family N-acetyltransferase [Paenibacillus sp. alder61]|uniref:GNAT family N-acetyltransferase n=1 Tax=Paenibacillus sp. alder61 TaxID=2862948 RepID=UPI001CD7C13F|nr:GNAT family N-acetyltransferase [Paenibacillus sp. alder61]MCA1294332.1 GNAT family N-acetyltransferase [Paenibacillus sp. alder61]